MINNQKQISTFITSSIIYIFFLANLLFLSCRDNPLRDGFCRCLTNSKITAAFLALKTLKKTIMYNIKLATQKIKFVFLLFIKQRSNWLWKKTYTALENLNNRINTSLGLGIRSNHAKIMTSVKAVIVRQTHRRHA